MKQIKNPNDLREQLLPYLQDYLNLKGVRVKKKMFSCIETGHNDKNPSCSIAPDGTYYNCFSCGAKGTIIDAYSILEGKEVKGQGFFEALETLAVLFGISVEYDESSEYPKYREYLYTDEDGNAQYKQTRIDVSKRDKKFHTESYVNGSYESGLGDRTDRYVYNYTNVIKAIQNKKTIFYS